MKTNLYALMIEQDEAELERRRVLELRLAHRLVQVAIAVAVIVFGVLVVVR